MEASCYDGKNVLLKLVEDNVVEDPKENDET